MREVGDEEAARGEGASRSRAEREKAHQRGEEGGGEEGVRLLVLVPFGRDAREVHRIPRHDALKATARERRGNAETLGLERAGGVVVVHQRVEREHQGQCRDAREHRDAKHRHRRHRGDGGWARAPDLTRRARPLVVVACRTTKFTKSSSCDRVSKLAGRVVAAAFDLRLGIRVGAGGSRRADPSHSSTRWRPRMMATSTITWICRCARAIARTERRPRAISVSPASEGNPISPRRRGRRR